MYVCKGFLTSWEMVGRPIVGCAWEIGRCEIERMGKGLGCGRWPGDKIAEIGEQCC